MRSTHLHKTLAFIGLLCSLMSCISNKSGNREFNFEETFDQPLSTEVWHVEMDPQPNSSVSVENGQLVVDTKGGVTVWLKKELNNQVTIEFDRTIVVEDGVNDRLSDMNQFWLATDPRSENLFTRTGKFEEYDSLSLYYVGIGGNYNTTTRFRRYQGNGQKPIIGENNTEEALLQPNKTYHIKIVLNGQKTLFYVDDRVLFEHHDQNPIQNGYFGFRSTWSRQIIDNLKIYTTKQ